MKALGVDPAAQPPLRAPDGAQPRGTVLFGRFEVVREVAHTPHARLVEAFDRVGQRSVAVKLFAPSQAATGRDALVRFEREARALAQLRHPSIVPLVAYLSEGPAMALEWMSGGSLAELLAREAIAPARAVEIAAALLGALGVAHRLGILHRDVKPSNVLFDAIGSPRLSDFGAAHLGDGQDTATAGAIGTFAYMSPEQRLGRPATVQSDVYAAGALLYEMLTGEAAEPLEGDGFAELAPSAFHPDLGDPHDAAIAAMLQRDPPRRPLDAFDARKRLEALTWPRDVVPRPAPVSSRGRTSAPPTSRPERVVPARGAIDRREADRAAHDAWTGRDVLLIPLDPAELARARAFARASHAALPSVLRASATEGTIWVEPTRGVALADRGEPLTRGQVATLAEAVAELHALGGAHGALDAEHVVVDGDRVAVAYPRAAPTDGAREADQLALVRLGATARG
jgi:serine/threonine-protein kinase